MSNKQFNDDILLFDDITPNIYEYYYDLFKRFIKQNALDENIVYFNNKNNGKKTLPTIMQDILNTSKLEGIKFEKALNKSKKFANLENNNKHNNIQVMPFVLIILYKTLPCPQGQQCKYKPREIAPYNQYSDDELSCIYYHHYKDRRRLPITPRIRDEFLYKANYDKKKEMPCNIKYSINYFESLYHPIYYKLFKCKRAGCNQSYFCPFNHNQYEKLLWDEIFQFYVLKKREMYTGKNYNYCLKDLKRISFEILDPYPQNPEKDLLDIKKSNDDDDKRELLSSSSSSSSPPLDEDYITQEKTLDSINHSNSNEDDMYKIENYRDIEDLLKEDNNITSISLSLSSLSSSVNNTKAPNSYLNSPIFTFTRSPVVTSTLNWKISNQAISYSSSLSDNQTSALSSPDAVMFSNNLLKHYVRKAQKATITVATTTTATISATACQLEDMSNNGNMLTHDTNNTTNIQIPASKGLCDNHGETYLAVSLISSPPGLENNLNDDHLNVKDDEQHQCQEQEGELESEKSIHPLHCYDDNKQNIEVDGSLGVFFDTEKIKNIMTFQLW